MNTEPPVPSGIASLALPFARGRPASLALPFAPALPFARRPGRTRAERADGRAMARFAILVGTVLLLQVLGSAQALSDTQEKKPPARLGLKEIILGVKSAGPPPGAVAEIKVFSGEEQAWRAGPEEDLDHLHHPEDNVAEDAAHVRLLPLPRHVLSGPEEDRDHIYHGAEEEM